ncbi:MAG: MFS transporter [Saprospiraceae bacterium]|nr:MFS transporter [Saprospiraceae bacterium]
MKIITRTVWILSVISLLTDTASEMLYPVLPVYLKSIGFSVVLIGILEGIAEATAGLSKAYFGKLSDLSGKRVPFVQLGYTLSAVAKPMMALFAYPLWIFAARTMERLGKGIRTGARDALLSDEASSENKAKIFGFHRSMDTLGAVLGPCIALLYLYYHPEDYIRLFYIAFIPGLLAILASLYLKDRNKSSINKSISYSPFQWARYWKESPDAYKRLIAGLLLFALINSSDVFLILKAKESGISDTYVIGLYIFYNLIYALFSYPAGVLADRTGLKKVFISGLILFSAVYFGMAFADSLYGFLLMFVIYGIYAAGTEGISKAWISNITDRKDTATAIGLYAGLQSVATMLASSLTGAIWYSFGASAAFIFIAFMTLLVVIYLIIWGAKTTIESDR